MIAGVYTPTKGKIIVNGKLVPFIELGVGFNSELSGKDNVFLNGALLGFSRKEMTEMYDEIVTFAELEDHMNVKLKNFSSGMQVRLAFSIAIRAKSDILLIDEVLAVGDAAFQQKCFNYFEELKRQRRTVVFVSHDMSSVRRFCSMAAYVEQGKLTLVGTPDEVAERYAEDNMEQTATVELPSTEPQLSRTHLVTGKITKQTSHGLSFEVKYKSQDDDAMFVGISVLHNAMSIAEIITPPHKPLLGSGSVVYELDTTRLNEGAYFIAIALFRLENRELIAIGKRKCGFVVKGGDITRGGVLRLEDTWEYRR